MNALDVLLPLIRKSEGCKLKAYQCPAGIWTIGYGSTGKNITEGLEWNQSQADISLINRATQAINEALRVSPILIPHPNKTAAIADLIFNLGLGGYVGHSLKPLVDAGDWVAAASEIQLFCRAGGKVLAGLQTRRITEAKLLVS